MKEAKVLLVDDAEAFTSNMSRLLSRRGYDVMAVNDGESAIKAVEENDFDVVLLDMKMPGMHGLTALKEMKKRRPSIEVIILSAYGTVDLAVDGMHLGAFDYVVKPAEFEELQTKIDEAYQHKLNREDKS